MTITTTEQRTKDNVRQDENRTPMEYKECGWPARCLIYPQNWHTHTLTTTGSTWLAELNLPISHRNPSSRTITTLLREIKGVDCSLRALDTLQQRTAIVIDKSVKAGAQSKCIECENLAVSFIMMIATLDKQLGNKVNDEFSMAMQVRLILNGNEFALTIVQKLHHHQQQQQQ